MFQRIVDLLLLCGLVSGACYFFQSASLRGDLAKEHARLVRKVGTLQIKSPDKVYLQALDTGEPLHFAWRVYLPENHTFGMNSKTRLRSSGSSSRSEFTLRYRFYQQRGKWFVYKETFYFNHGTDYEVKSPDLIAALSAGLERIRQLQIEQLGLHGTVEIGREETVVLLKIRLPQGERPPANAPEPYLEWILFGPEDVYKNPVSVLPPK